jgi:hypothetical protein
MVVGRCFYAKNVLAYSGTVATFSCSIYRIFQMYFNKRLWRENENWFFEQIDEIFKSASGERERG